MKNKISKEDIKNALRSIADEANGDLEDYGDFFIGPLFPDDFDSIKDDTQYNLGGFNLKDVPIYEWKNIRVSPISLFGEKRWDFTCYPHSDPGSATAIFDGKNKSGLNFFDENNFHLLQIAKALLFYCIPKFSYKGSGGSYGSMSSRRARMVKIMVMLKDFDIYRNGTDGYPSNSLNEVSKEKIIDYIESRDTVSSKWEIAHALGLWQELSRSNLLPVCYSIHHEFITKEEISKYRNNYDSASVGYLPLELDDYAALFDYAKTVVQDYSKDILWLARTYCPRVEPEEAENRLILVDGVSTASPEGVRLFKEYQPLSINGEPWWNLCVIERSHPRDKGEYILYTEVQKRVSELFDSAITIIFSTTGLRRSEVRLLKSGCISEDSDGYWLTYAVFKTSVASQGHVRRIPVPKVTAQAVAALETLCDSSRRYGGHDNLLSTVIRVDYFGCIPNTVYAERSLNRVAVAAGIDKSVHAHQFRKSLAMYFIYQDPENIDLISYIFDHRSLKMTFKYILSLPSVAAEIHKHLVEQNLDILVEVLEAASSGKIGGFGGMRVMKALESSKSFSARLQDSGKETLKEYIDSLLEEGVVMLHRTSMAICLKTPATHEFSPCIGKNEAATDRLNPNIWACSPGSCNFAAFTERHAESLESEITFHRNKIKHPYASKSQIAFSEGKIVECRKRLREIRAKESVDV